MNKHLGGDFDEFLREEKMQEDVTAAALTRVLDWQLEQAMKVCQINKIEMA